MVKRSPIVYLPVEFRAREFDGKALLAAVLAKRGYSVLFGQQWEIYENLDRVPPGVVLFKSFNKYHQPLMRTARQSGHAVFLLEEELLAHTEAAAIANFCNQGVFELPDVILANSECEKEVLTSLGGDKVKIEVAGNPRIDFLKPPFHPFYKREMDIVLDKFGDFILVNTNFGTINSTWRDVAEVTRIHVEAGFVKLDDPASVQAWEDQLEFEHLNKAAIITAVKELCRRRPGLNVVLRPHPAEAIMQWKGVFDEHPRVAVVREGPHLPWTLSARMLLHTSCTTGMEAAVAGKTALSLVVKPNWISQSFISNRLNPMFTDPVAFVDAAEAHLDGRAAVAAPELDLAAATRYVWNIADKNGANRIAALLTADLPSPRARVQLPAMSPYTRDQSQIHKISISLNECGEVVGKILGIIGKARALGLDQVGDSLFYLAPAA